jgi:hypothetical protein
MGRGERAGKEGAEPHGGFETSVVVRRPLEEVAAYLSNL